MKNKEKYEKELVNLAIYNLSFGVVEGNGELAMCEEIDCENCIFRQYKETIGCEAASTIWANKNSDGNVMKLG